jgi:hypothetical protein
MPQREMPQHQTQISPLVLCALFFLPNILAFMQPAA